MEERHIFLSLKHGNNFTANKSIKRRKNEENKFLAQKIKIFDGKVRKLVEGINNNINKAFIRSNSPCEKNDKNCYFEWQIISSIIPAIDF